MVLDTDLHTNYEPAFARSARFMHEIYMTFSPLALRAYIVYSIYCVWYTQIMCQYVLPTYVKFLLYNIQYMYVPIAKQKQLRVAIQ